MIEIILLVFIICGILYYLFKTVATKPVNVKKYSQIKKVDNFYNDLKKIHDSTEIINNSKKERELYELYYRGIPDVYVDDTLVKGVEPDAIKAIHNLNLIIQGPFYTDRDVLNLAKIYHYGMYKFERDLNKAEETYMSIKTNDNNTIQIIREALADIKKIRTYEWLNLPMEKRPEVTIPVRIVPQTVNVPRIVNIPRIAPLNRINSSTKREIKEYNDPQNTHNSQVLSTIRHSLEKLKNTPIIHNKKETVRQIKEYIEKFKESDKKRDALKSLGAIEKNETPLSSTDMTEIEALNLVWNRISDPELYSEESKNNVKEILFDQLASMQEHGATICSTGRFTHIIDSLNGIDKDVTIKPTYAILEEMMNKSSKIREDMLVGVSKEIENSDKFAEDLKNTIVTKLNEDYVQTGILSEAKFFQEINKWIDYV